MADPIPLPSRMTQMNAIMDSAKILDIPTQEHIARLVRGAHENDRTSDGKLVLIEDPRTKHYSVILDYVEDPKVIEQIYRLVMNLKRRLNQPVDT